MRASLAGSWRYRQGAGIASRSDGSRSKPYACGRYACCFGRCSRPGIGLAEVRQHQHQASRMRAPGRYNTGYVWTISAVAALGGLLFSYDWVVIGGAKPFYEKFFRLGSEEFIGWANSCALIGCLAGSVVSGAMSDRFGRKKLLVLTAVLFAVSSVFTGWAGTFSSFVIWRIIGGVAIGIASNVSPTYIAEISPAPWRGGRGTLNQMSIVGGVPAVHNLS